MSLGTIAIVAVAYVFMMVLVLALLSACKRDDQELDRTAERRRAERARTREKESTTVSRD